MKDEKKDISYKNITKATAIFGGTQVMSMAANIIKGKLAACLVGAYGLGISALLYSTATPIQQLFTCGLNVSAVKDISSAPDDAERSERIICFRRMITALASTAMVTTAASAWWLSQLTFGSQDHWAWFIAIALAVFFLILASGETTILQGCRQLKQLAICNMTAPMAGLAIAMPLYWLLGIEGIAPSIAVLGFASWFVAKHFTRRLDICHSKQTWRETLKQGQNTIIMGASIMGSSIAGSIATYIINTSISHIGSETDLGFYQSSMSITLQCTSMVFSAMAADYFPHLSSIAKQRHKAQDLVCKEGEISILIIAPIAIALITAAPLAIRILLTSEFDASMFLLRAMSLCLISKAVCFPLDYVCLANGDNKLFLIMEGVWSNVKTIAIVILGYAIAQLDGIGIALCIGAIIDVAVSISVNKWKYGISYSDRYYKIAIALTATSIICFIASTWLQATASYTVMIAATVCAWWFAYKKIDERINIKEIIKNKFHGKG